VGLDASKETASTIAVRFSRQFPTAAVVALALAMAD
jgi:hypothetical protein